MVFGVGKFNRDTEICTLLLGCCYEEFVHLHYCRTPDEGTTVGLKSCSLIMINCSVTVIVLHR